MGLLERKVLSVKPFTVAYEITDFGKSALVFLEQLKDWSIENNI